MLPSPYLEIQSDAGGLNASSVHTNHMKQPLAAAKQPGESESLSTVALSRGME